MDLTHLHLVITHLPIMGSLLGAIVLFHGLWTNSSQTRIAAYIVFICSAVGAGIAYLTGESAEETVENIQGVAESMIEQHENIALASLIGLLIVGTASLIGIYLESIKSTFSRKFAVGLLLASIISFGLVGYTGYQGGQIRHTEINNITASGEPGNMEQEDID